MKVSTDIAMPAMATDTRGNDTADGSEFAALLAGFAALPTTPPTAATSGAPTAPPDDAAAGVPTPADLAFANAAAMAITTTATSPTAPNDLPAAATATETAWGTTVAADVPVPAPPLAPGTPAGDADAITVIDLTVAYLDDAAPSAGPLTMPQVGATEAGAAPPTVDRPTPVATDAGAPADAPDAASPGVQADVRALAVDDPGAPRTSARDEALPNPTATRHGATGATNANAALSDRPAGVDGASSAAAAATSTASIGALVPVAEVDVTTSKVDAAATKVDVTTTNVGAAAAAGGVLAPPASGEQLEVTGPKLVIPPNRVDTVAVAAARASAEASRPIRLSVRLDPPNLGEVRVELTARGNQVTMRLEPTAELSGPALHNQRNAVAAALERTGFQLAGFDVANPEQHKQGFVPKQSGRRDATTEAEEPIEPTVAADGLRL